MLLAQFAQLKADEAEVTENIWLESQKVKTRLCAAALKFMQGLPFESHPHPTWNSFFGKTGKLETTFSDDYENLLSGMLGQDAKPGMDPVELTVTTSLGRGINNSVDLRIGLSHPDCETSPLVIFKRYSDGIVYMSFASKHMRGNHLNQNESRDGFDPLKQGRKLGRASKFLGLLASSKVISPVHGESTQPDFLGLGFLR